MLSKGSSIVAMPSARWCAVDGYNFLQLIENMTPTDCYAIKYIKRQSLPCIHSSPTQLSLFTADLKGKDIFNFVIYTIVSHKLQVYAKQLLLLCLREKGYYEAGWWRSVSVLEPCRLCWAVGLTQGAFQNFWIAV